jgi:hypothetical protein
MNHSDVLPHCEKLEELRVDTQWTLARAATGAPYDAAEINTMARIKDRVMEHLKCHICNSRGDANRPRLRLATVVSVPIGKKGKR